jgi:L-threonylcarbamoyladenylate synthase
MESIGEHIQNAVKILNNGGIVIFPTDTAFGIGCRMDTPDSVNRLFEIRKRPKSQATPVLVDSIEMALAYFDNPSNIVRHLMSVYWPGALTIVAPCKSDQIYSPIRGASNKVGLRMPNNQTILSLIGETGVPILGPSANFHGSTTPYAYEDLDSKLLTLVDYVLPGECSIKEASTVVDCYGQSAALGHRL